MKKIIVFMLVLSMIASMMLVGCEPIDVPDDTTGSTDNDTTAGDVTTVSGDNDETTADDTTTAGDTSSEETTGDDSTPDETTSIAVKDPGGFDRSNIAALGAAYIDVGGVIKQISNNYILTDGAIDYTNVSSEYVNMKFAESAQKDETYTYKTTEGDKQYRYMLIVELFDHSATVDGFTMYTAGYKPMVVDAGFDILVSSDGITWTLAWTGTDLINSKGYEKLDYEATSDVSAYAAEAAYVTADFPAIANVKYIAYAPTTIREASGHFVPRFTEFQIYGTVQ